MNYTRDLLEQYRARFGGLPTIFDRNPKDVERDIIEALWTGVPIREPKLRGHLETDLLSLHPSPRYARTPAVAGCHSAW